MKKLNITLLLIIIVVQFASAQLPYAIIKGHVFKNDTRSPVEGQTMIISVDSLNSSGYHNKVVTDASGFYTDKIQFNPGSAQIAISVSTYECNGALVTSTAHAYPNSADATLDFLICSNQVNECVAKFKTQPGSNNMLSLYFMDASYSSYGAIQFKYLWDFGDGTTSADQSLLHTFDKPGVYNVCLRIINSNDSLCSSSFCLPVQVGSIVPNPCENTFRYYNDSTSKGYIFEGSVINGQADFWYWDFGDGTTATGQKVLHSFPRQDINYKVCLTSTGMGPGGNACKAYSCQALNIYNPSLCESSFSYYADSIGSGYSFVAHSQNNQVKSWTWDFGDGTIASGKTVSHSFPSSNTKYKVCLTTIGSDPNGTTCTFVSCHDVYINVSSPCESSFLYHADPTGSYYTFEGFAKNNHINTWMWDFGDGTTATGQKAMHSFINSSNVPAGHYVCLKTTGIGADGVTCTFNSCQEIHIPTTSPCKNYFKAYDHDGLTYSFSGNVESGVLAFYYWDFGDGDTATGQQVSHTFRGNKAEISYNVCLTTIVAVPGSTGFNECKSISCQLIYPTNGLSCKADMSAISDSAKNTYRFQNLSQSKFRYSYWHFGDGNQSSEANPFHTYLSPGLYKACLTIGDSLNNCLNQTCQEIWVDMVQAGCKASFYAFSPDSIDNSINFMFINTSTEGLYTNQKWSFGDGTGSTEFNASHTFNTPGNYKVCLTIWDSIGKCQSTYCADVFAGKVNNNNTVSGIVTAGNKVADQGIVWLIGANNNYNDQKLIDSTGMYLFTGVPAGAYYIYAMLTPGSSQFFNYMPTYYASSLSWQGATIIKAGETNAWYRLSLAPSMNWSQGAAVITGNINWGGKTQEDGNPLANIEVVLYNNSGSPIAYTFTNSDGTFEFNNLPYGEYSLQAEMPGKVTQLIRVKLSESNSTVNIDFKVNESAIYLLGLDNQYKTKIIAGNPFPNPVLGILSLELNVQISGMATVEVIDMQGKVIKSEFTELSKGQNLIRIQTGDFKKGVYQLRIKTEGQKPVQRRFVR